jgi:hypothetical protein
MSKKATVYKLPAKYVIVKDDKISFAKSQYTATTEAINMGATRVEMGEWTELLRRATSRSQS